VAASAIECSKTEHQLSELERLREVVVGAEELLERAWDESADPFTNAVRITVSGLRKRLGVPWIIATVAGVGYRIDAAAGTQREGGDTG
jgi:two-component system, OmpR family, response regulator VanR